MSKNVHYNTWIYYWYLYCVTYTNQFAWLVVTTYKISYSWTLALRFHTFQLVWYKIATRQSEMADLARRATRWVGPSFIMIGWEMAEILHFEILRKHGQTWALQYLALPLWGEVMSE